jgi:hypothetical protein
MSGSLNGPDHELKAADPGTRATCLPAYQAPTIHPESTPRTGNVGYSIHDLRIEFQLHNAQLSLLEKEKK